MFNSENLISSITHEEISGEYEKLKEFYRTILESFALKGLPFVSKFLHLLTKGSKSVQIRKAVLRQTAAFAISDIEKECPWISRDLIRLVLRELKSKKVIKLQGKGRGAKWLLK